MMRCNRTKIIGAVGVSVVALVLTLVNPEAFSRQSRGIAQQGAVPSTKQLGEVSGVKPLPKPAGETGGDADPESFALIELFTSQGCSSCPSADQNLARIAANTQGKNVYTLSYHVDYWNYLGWKDPYSSSAHSNRQRQYARQFDSNSIYTPQMVVNGRAEFVGSKVAVSDRAVASALELKAKATVRVKAAAENNRVTASWQASGLNRSDLVNIALVQNRATQKVKRGENARRRLSHVNVVRQLKSMQAAKSGSVEFDTPAGFEAGGYHVVVFVQSSRNVRAAARGSIAAASKSKPMGFGRTESSKVKSDSMGSTDAQMAVTAFKPTLADTQADLVGAEQFLRILDGNESAFDTSLKKISESWDVSYVPMLLEVSRFMSVSRRAKVIVLLESKTGKRFGSDSAKWMKWSWKQEYDQHPGYAKFKSALYGAIDSRFEEYFVKTKDAKIRLDEIRWGGVRRDGIPPLKNPKMISAEGATYLADSDVVFGIELNGEARAYPKRILAWHEMFKDTIGGESVCGVY
jgi:hypothetical protein